MAMKGAGENLCVEATTAENLESTSIPKMTAVMNHPHSRQKDHHLSSFQALLWSLLQGRGARVVTMPPADGAVHLRTRVMRERVTVMELWMEVLMMVTKVARDRWCAEATTVRSLGHTTMRKMTAVRNLPPLATQRVVTMPMSRVSSPSLTMEQCTTSAYGMMPTTNTTRPGVLPRWMLRVAMCPASGATVAQGALLRLTKRWTLCPGLSCSGASGACLGLALWSAMGDRQEGTETVQETVATQARVSGGLATLTSAQRGLEFGGRMHGGR